MRCSLPPTLLCLALLVGLAPGVAAQAPTPNADGSYTIPYNWGLKPSGLDGGDRFRLLFVTSTVHFGSGTTIAGYNSLVTGAVNTGHSLIRPYNSQFRALISTAAVDARDNTSTTGTGEPIYWLNGVKAADNYADFYDGTWDSNAARTESGAALVLTSTTPDRVWTGSEADGTGYTNHEAGTAQVRVGILRSASTMLSGEARSSGGQWRLYAMSPVFLVGAAPELTITAGTGITEGAAATFTVAINPASTVDLTVNLQVDDAASPSDFVATNAEGAQTFTISANATSATYTVTTTGDAVDEPNGVVGVTLQNGTGYAVGSQGSATVAVTDDDVTTVTLAGLAVDTPEREVLEFTVGLSRALVASEILPVPVTFAGTASPGSDYTVNCPGTLPTGVACAGLGSASATITFTGPTATPARVLLTLRAVVEGTVESPEPVIIGLGTLNANSGTGLGGGATGVDNLADFNIVEPQTVELSFASGASGVNEGTANAAAELEVFVLAGVVPQRGARIPITVNAAPAVTGDASSADYGTVPTHIVIGGGEASAKAELSIVNDGVDELRERIRFGVGTLPSGYALFGGAIDVASLRVLILDNDPTPVSLTGGGAITEQNTSSTQTMTVRLARPLRQDPFNPGNTEQAVVRVNLASTTGAALPGDTSPLFSVAASGTGVSVSGQNTAQLTLTFTGSNTQTVQTATITFTATANGDVDSLPETVTATLGTLTPTHMEGGLSAASANSATLTVNDDDPLPELSVAVVGGSTSVTEGGSATIRVTRTGTTVLAQSFSATATTADGFTNAFNPNPTSIPAGQASVDITYSVTNDNADRPNGTATYVLDAGSDYAISATAGSVSLAVVDNDATAVTLAGAAGNVEEGGQKTVTVTLNRGLESGEVLAVSLTFGGTATRGTDYTLTGASGTGLSYQNLNSGSASVTFTGPNSGTTATVATLTLSATSDQVIESTPETVDMGLGTLDQNSGTGLGGGASGTDNLAQFSIEDPPASAVNLSVSNAGAVTEGGGALTITATLGSANTAGNAISIPIQVRSTGTTAAASDYTVASSISIANNSQSGTTSFTALDDQIAEGPETVVIELGAPLPPNVTPGTTTHFTITITDNDTPGLVVSPPSLSVAEDGTARYTVQLVTEPTSAVTVAITGHAGTDLTLDPTSLSFTPSNWNDAQTVTVSASKDADTSDDTATLLHTASGGGYDAVEATVAVTVTETDDEPEPEASFASTSSSVPESAGTHTVTVNLSPPAGAGITVSYTVDGTATPGTDYAPLAGSVSVASGATSASIPVTITDDTAEESNETIVLTLTSGAGYTVGSPTSHTLTIIDNDGDRKPPPFVCSPPPPLGLTLADTTIVEGDIARFVVRLKEAMDHPVCVEYVTASGTARVGQDYIFGRGQGILFIRRGATTDTIKVPTLPDTEAEGTETFIVRLLNTPEMKRIEATGTILDDDVPQAPSGLTIADATVVEGEIARFVVRLDTAETHPVVVAWTTASGTAQPGQDYDAGRGTLRIPPGETTSLIEVQTLTDTEREGDEVFAVRLLNAPSKVEATGTILSALPRLTLSDTTVVEGEIARFVVRLAEGPVVGVVPVKWTTVSGTARASQDYDASHNTLRIPPGETTGLVEVQTLPDAEEEGDEMFAVRLFHSDGPIEATGTISDPSVPFGFTEAVEDQAYTAKTAITPLVLPAAGGTPPLTYRLAGLPADLTFDPATRTMAGTPAEATNSPVPVTYMATASSSEGDTLIFTIMVNPELTFDDLFPIR